MTTRSAVTRSAVQRVGFTLVELLVVIAIIGMLAGLMLPAVQQAREAGRRAECTNNQRNVALALINYEGARTEFPGFRQKAGELEGASWYYAIFPYIEQTNLYDRFQAVGSVTVNTFDLARWVEDPANGRELLAIGVFKCSSSGRRENADADYVVNCGPTNVARPGATWSGGGAVTWTAVAGVGTPLPPPTVGNNAPVPVVGAAFERGGYSAVFFNKSWRGVPNTTSSVSLEYVTSKNGTSNTFLTSENVNAGRWTDTDERQIGFCYPNIWDSNTNPNDTVGNFEGVDTNTATVVDYVTTGFPYWINAGKIKANTNGYRVSRPSSNHPGIVVTSFCDGSVRPVSDAMTKGTFINAMQPGGSGVFGANAFN